MQNENLLTLPNPNTDVKVQNNCLTIEESISTLPLKITALYDKTTIAKSSRNKSINIIIILIIITVILIFIINIIKQKLENSLRNKITDNYQTLKKELAELQDLKLLLEQEVKKERKLNHSLRISSKTKENILLEINNKQHEHLLNLEKNNLLTGIIEINDEIEELSLSSILNECKNLYEFYAYKNNITIEFPNRSPLPVIISNKLVFKLLMINLLGQSITYLPKDKIIKLNTYSHGEGESKATIVKIEDNGFGINIDPRIQPISEELAFNFFELEWDTIERLAKSLGYIVKKELRSYEGTTLKLIIPDSAAKDIEKNKSPKKTAKVINLFKDAE